MMHMIRHGTIDARAESTAGVRPILHRGSGDVIGYRIEGAENGPTVVATGFRSAVAPVFHRLAQLPSLPRLRGRLILTFADEIDRPESGLCLDTLVDGPAEGPAGAPADDAIFFGYQSLPGMTAEARLAIEREVYWTILRHCAALGMITGRGVPAARRAQPDQAATA